MFNPPSPQIPTENQAIKPVLPPQGQKPRAKQPVGTFLGFTPPTAAAAMGSSSSGGKTLLGA